MRRPVLAVGWGTSNVGPTPRRPPTPAAGRPSSILSSSILSVVKDEQKYAAESYRRDPELLDGPPNDFELFDERGSRSVSLMKEYKDEQVVVDMELEDSLADEPELEDEEGADDDDGTTGTLPEVRFRVSVVKPAHGAMIFRCASNGTYVSIRELALDDKDEAEEEDEDSVEDVYTGPPFEDLDDTLQQAFLDYLEERGVTAELGRYLQLLAEDKAAVEYLGWLARVRDFLSHG